jgi:hypothetical protein
MGENNNSLNLISLIEQECGVPQFSTVESGCKATYWDLAINTELLRSPPLDSGNYDFNFNSYVNLRWFALAPLDPNFVLNRDLTLHSLHYDELMGIWLKNLFKQLGLETDYLYFFNFTCEGHLYLNLNEEQFDRLNALLHNEIYNKKGLDLAKWYSESKLKGISGIVNSMKGGTFDGRNLFAAHRLDKHFLLHMFDNDVGVLFFMLYRLKFKNYSRLKCNTVTMTRDVMQRKFQELLPKCVRCAKLRFEYKINSFECFYIKYATWADWLNFYLSWNEELDPDSFVAHTVSYDWSGSVFLNLYISHPNSYDEDILKRVSKGQSGFFLSRDQEYSGNFINSEIVGEVICHGLDYIESHIALQPFEGELISYSLQQPQHNFSFQCYKALYRDGLGVEHSAYTSKFLHQYCARLAEECNKRDEDSSIMGLVTI